MLDRSPIANPAIAYHGERRNAANIIGPVPSRVRPEQRINTGIDGKTSVPRRD